MNKLLLNIISVALFSLSSCSSTNIYEDPNYYYFEIDNNYELSTNLKEGNNERIHVIALLGQSNATGCSYNEYLKKSVDEEQYQIYEQGFENVKTVFCLDNHSYCSVGEFVTTGLNCAAGEDRFGPETGMAEILNIEKENEKYYILKFSMSGYSLNYHWLFNYERFFIYDAATIFIKTYMNQFIDLGYNATLDAICWMQGESDTTYEKAERYLENTKHFVSYLREDLNEYIDKDLGLHFIDAGISNSPYCEPAYKEINAAKVEFAKLSPLNHYFPTIENGLTTLYEPYENPDLGHYDALSMLKLGHLFGENLISIYNNK